MGTEFIFPTEVFGLQNALIEDKINIYRGLPQGSGVDAALRISKIGTPVYSDLLLKGGSYSDNSGNQFTFPDIYFDTVVMVINQQKRIIQTDIQGRDGSVNEYIGMSNYDVTINAVLTFDNGKYDRDAISNLKQLLVAPVSIKCVSWYLQLWDIDELIIRDFSIPQQQGQYSMQPIAINAQNNNSLEITEY